MGERFTHGGVEYEDLGNGKVRVIRSVAPAPFTATPLPLGPEQQEAADRARRDQQIQEEAARDKRDADARATREWYATHNPDGSPKVPQQQAPSGYRFAPGGNLEAIPGGPADNARNGKALRQGDSDKLRAAVNQFADMERVRSNFIPDFGGNPIGSVENWAQGYVSGVGTPGQHDWWSDLATMDNIIRNNLFGASLTEGEKAAYNRTTISPGMDPKEITKNLSRRQEVMRGALQRYISGLKAGGWSGAEIDALVGDQAPALYPQQQKAPGQQRQRNDPALSGAMAGPQSGGDQGGGGVPPLPPFAPSDAPLTAAPAGSTSQVQPIPPQMQTELDAYIAQNGRNTDPGSLRQFIVGLYGKYGATPGPNLDEYAEATAAALRNGGQIDTNIPPQTVPLSGADALRNDLVNNPVGAFAANMGNAGGFGIPGLLAGEQMGALRDANPISSTLGEVAGGITGTMVAGAGLGAGSKLITNPAVRGALANPLAADVAYGAAYGASQSDDPLYGAAGGVAGALAGNFIGSRVARALPGAVRGAPADPLSRGERAVLTAVDRTGVDPVAQALMQANDLGVPASLADVSMDVNSLTGAALRRSPVAAALARDTLGTRSLGQYDRLVGAVERDLGPVANIPQRSEDLIQQARAAAGPLYDAAYAAPGAGASFPAIEPLLNRPSMQRALARARTIAAEEGRDPTTLGFDLDVEGNTILNQVPSWQTLDYAKRGIDDVLETFRDGTTGRLNLDEHGRAIDNTRREFLSLVDQINPDYAAARASYAGPAAERDALARGQAAVSMSPDSLAVNVGSATPVQQDQMRLGFQSKLVENAGRVRNSSNPFDSTFGTPAMEQRLATMYPEGTGDVSRLLAQRDLERSVAASSNRLIGNSMTAERQLADEAFGQGGGLGDAALEVGANIALGQIPIGTAIRGGLSRGVRDQFKLGIGRRGRQLAEEIAPLALDTDTENAIARLLAIQSQDQSHQAVIDGLLQTAGQRGARIGAGSGSAVAAALMRN